MACDKKRNCCCQERESARAPANALLFALRTIAISPKWALIILFVDLAHANGLRRDGAHLTACTNYRVCRVLVKHVRQQPFNYVSIAIIQLMNV